MKIPAFVIFLLFFMGSCTQDSNQVSHSGQNNKKAIATSTLQDPPSQVGEARFVTAKSGLSLRSDSNLRSEKMMVIPYGSQVTVTEIPKHTALTVEGVRGKMIAVDYQGAQGYVFDGYTSRLFPVRSGEGLTSYHQRLVQKELPSTLQKKIDPRGEQFGMETRFTFPATRWEEATPIVKDLFHLPDFIAFLVPKAAVYENPKKGIHAKKDEVRIVLTGSNQIKTMIYTYELLDYKRIVTIEQQKDAFLITDIEKSF